MNPRDVEREFAAEVLMVQLLELMDLDGTGHQLDPQRRWAKWYTYFLSCVIEAQTGRGVLAEELRGQEEHRAMLERFRAAGQLLGWAEVKRLLRVLEEACRTELGASDHHVWLWSVLHKVIQEGQL